MSIKERIQAALEQAEEGTPVYDLFMLLLLKAVELGEGNEGLLYTYIKEARDAINALSQDIDAEHRAIN